MRFLQKIKNADVKRIKLFGITIYKRVRKDLFFYYYLMGIKCFKRDLKIEFYNRHKKIFKKYDKFYILNANIGEVYLFFKYFANSIIASDKSLLIATKKVHVDIIQTLMPECNYIFCKDVDQVFIQKDFRIYGKDFKILFTHNYYVSLEKEIRESNMHYFEKMKEILTCEKLLTNKVNISENVENSLFIKVKKLGLKLDKFVIIAPEGNSCSDLNHSFVKRIIEALKEKGFDIFLNLVEQSSDLSGEKSCFLTLPELYRLSEKAKAIIGVRSGLIEYIAECGTPSYIIYTSFKNRTKDDYMFAEKAYSGFTLTKLPQNNYNIKEYIVNSELAYEKTVAAIMEEICKV